MPRKSAAATASPGGLQFIQIHKPNDGSWRRVVRSHTSRRLYAEARQRYAVEDKKLEADDNHPQQLPSGDARQTFSNPLADTTDRSVYLVGRDDGYESKWNVPAVPDPRMPLQIRSIDPFNSLARPTTRFENYLLDHYIRYVTIHTDLCAGFAARDYMRSRSGLHCVQTAVGDSGLLNAIFLSACRSLARIHASNVYADCALEYKGACIRSVNNAISQRGGPLTSGTLAIVLALAQDSCIAEDFMAARHHCKAAEMMVQMKGGPRAIHGERFLRTMVQWVTFDTDVPMETDPRKEIWKVLEGYLEEM
ncbi:hypothetical protein GQ53DRAFT_740455 [Thozetella sp. PMI_491]|nr:hypothetical protein GQ53DRAFT_740455 [Thozetella sp. PMI_491]